MTTHLCTSAPLSHLWSTGEKVNQHPRVRISTAGQQKLAIHRREQTKACDDTQRLTLLLGVPQAHLYAVEEDYYAAVFIEGVTCDQVILDDDFIDDLSGLLLDLWSASLPSSFTVYARREQPLVEPLRFHDYVATPIKALQVGRKHRRWVSEARKTITSSALPNSFVHGDLKLDNLIRTDSTDLALIDWECCGLGHAEEDLGNILGSIIFCLVAKATWESLNGEHRSADKLPTPTEEQLQNQVVSSMQHAQQRCKLLISKLVCSELDLDLQVIAASAYISLLCRLQGAIIAGSASTTIAVLESVLNTIISSGLNAFAEWIGGTRE